MTRYTQPIGFTVAGSIPYILLMGIMQYKMAGRWFRATPSNVTGDYGEVVHCAQPIMTCDHVKCCRTLCAYDTLLFVALGLVLTISGRAGT